MEYSAPLVLSLLYTQYFIEQKVDYVVLENSLGAMYDSTAVQEPLATAITSISFDHTEHLGTTLDEIAWHKAGILHSGIPCVLGPTVTQQIFNDRAAELGAPLIRVSDEGETY